jgi:Carboxypeptidase regulatory-like domain
VLYYQSTNVATAWVVSSSNCDEGDSCLKYGLRHRGEGLNISTGAFNYTTLRSITKIIGAGRLSRLSLSVILCCAPAIARAQSQQQPAGSEAGSGVSGTQQTGLSVAAQQADPQAPGTIYGTILDQSELAVAGAQLHLASENQSAMKDVVSGDTGQFSISDVLPGTYTLSVSAPGFAAQVVSVTVHPGEVVLVPQIVLPIETQVTSVTVGLTQVEEAEVQIKEQEKQRILGIIPNFYVSYATDAVALNWKQKYHLAWKSSTDPFTFIAVGGAAGVQQATNTYAGYGQGAAGYARRYGATYGDVVIGTYLGSAVLPSILKQDPRYFYKGKGSTRSRILYALSTPFVCKGDNGEWQPNYSFVGGSLAAGAIATLYHPTGRHSSADVFLTTSMLRLGENAVSSVFQEFIIRKLTPNLPKHNQPQN